jgi:Tol biopolymer transport system component
MRRLAFIAALICSLSLVYCGGGGGGSSNTSPAQVSVTVSPTSATVVVAQTQQFTARDQNGSAVAADWSVNDVMSGNATVGTVDISGLYTAPATVPNPATVTVKGCSRTDSTKCGTATVTITAPPEKIAFSDGFNIFTIDPNGTNLQQLTTNQRQNVEPWFSPDGKQLAFNTTRDGDNAIYIMNSQDGSSPTRVNTGFSYSTWPAWSPDGKKLAFVYLDNNESGVATVDLATLDVKKLTHDPCPGDSCSISERPSWSPDSKKIVYENYAFDIYTINADGTNPVNLTNTASIKETDPAWSPDGKTIAYVSQETGHMEIYLMNPDGTSVRKLTTTDVDANNPYPLFSGAFEPAWSPDSSTVIFTLAAYVSATDSYTYKLYTVKTDGTEAAIPLPNSPDNCLFPAWAVIK